ncbi:MAG: hypothetical protein F6K10_19600 [Moorea sp. SIO2B7]|nr:hypothetical protein [Moorena sp. SIO2B7]
MLEDFQRIMPASPPAAEIFAPYHLSYEFRREVAYREEFKNYCQWYRLTAQQHQQELEKMRQDINIFRWFRGK